tara:strand:+ start:952 stop:3573 length:2622 start_codon:yes stop_codon:yes gene_type:complete
MAGFTRRNKPLKGSVGAGELSDFAISNPAAGDLLIYDAVDGKWENGKTLSGSYTIGGTLTAGTLSVDNNATIGGNITLTGALDATGNIETGGTLIVQGATTLQSTLAVTGATTLSSTLGVTGTLTGSAFSFSGNGTVAGTLGVTGNVTMSGDASVTGTLTVGGLSISGLLTVDDLVANNSVSAVFISGTSISADTGSFTTQLDTSKLIVEGTLEIETTFGSPDETFITSVSEGGLITFRGYEDTNDPGTIRELYTMYPGTTGVRHQWKVDDEDRFEIYDANTWMKDTDTDIDIGHVVSNSVNGVSLWARSSAADHDVMLSHSSTGGVTGDAILDATDGGATRLYYNNQGVTRTEQSGLGLIDQSAGGSRLVGRTSGLVAQWDIREDVSATQVEINSFIHGYPITAIGEDAGGTAKTLWWADPDADFRAYQAGNVALATTATGAKVQHPTGSTPLLEFMDNGASRVGYLQMQSSNFVLENEQTSAHFLLYSYNSVPTRTLMAEFDPDNGADFYHTGLLAGGTQASGMLSQDTSGSNPSHLWCTDAGTSVGRIRHDGTDLLIEALNTSGGLQLIGEDALSAAITFIDMIPDDGIDFYAEDDAAGWGVYASLEDADGNGGSFNVFGTNPSFQLWDSNTLTDRYFLLRRAAGGGKINMRAEHKGDDFELTTRNDADDSQDVQIKLYAETVATNDAYLELYHNAVATVRTQSEQLEVYEDTAWREVVVRSEGSFTPAFTFATPGDLSITYSKQEGYYWRDGDLVYFRLRVGFTGANFTHTTASGNARITGLPFDVDTTNGGTPLYEAQVSKANDGWGSATLTDYVMVKGYSPNGQSFIQIFSDGPDQTSTTWKVDEFGSGNSGVLRLYGFYATSDAHT